MTHSVFEYRGTLYPEYLRHGNAMQFIAPVAMKFCKGKGVDVGAGSWPLPGAISVDRAPGHDALHIPGLAEGWDFVFSSHCLEHLEDPVAALEHWKDNLRPGGVLFLYLPHPDMEYWRPQNCRKHRHLFWPKDVAAMLRDLGFVDVIHGERDIVWSFAVVAFKEGK